MAGPLHGVRIIDISQMVTGPWATTQLADQGADVVKIEPPGLGDQMRAFPSFQKGGLTAVMISANRGKRSLCLDLTVPAAVDLVQQLTGEADVFVQNFRPGVIERIGLDPADLRAANPRLITVSITGYGRQGPMADRPVFDPVIQSITGHVALQVNPEIPFPDLVRHAVVDKATACYVAQAITAALFHRERTGEGQHIDLSMVDASLGFFWPDGLMEHTLLDDDVAGGPTIAQLYSLTQCADGQLVYFTGTNDQRLGLFRALGHPEWCDDARFNTIEGVTDPENFAELGKLITEAFSVLPVADVAAALVEHDVPHGMVMAPADVATQEQVVANDSVREYDHPHAGRTRQPRPPARFSASPCDPEMVAPLVGEHSDQVLAEFGLTADAIDALRAQGAVK